MLRPLKLTLDEQDRFFKLRVGDTVVVDGVLETISGLQIVDEPLADGQSPSLWMQIYYRNVLIWLINGELKKKEYPDSERRGNGELVELKSFDFMSLMAKLPVSVEDWERFRALRTGQKILVNGQDIILRQVVVIEDVDSSKNSIHWSCKGIEMTNLVITSKEISSSKDGVQVDLFDMKIASLSS